MDNELETIQQIYNVVVEFIINYSIQILGAIIILVISAKLAGWLGRLVTGLCEKKCLFLCGGHLLCRVTLTSKTCRDGDPALCQRA